MGLDAENWSLRYEFSAPSILPADAGDDEFEFFKGQVAEAAKLDSWIYQKKRCFWKQTWYPLVMTNIAMENHHLK